MASLETPELTLPATLSPGLDFLRGAAHESL
jgi:succinylglutamic semialdehyde dehydrogenase